jgi:hypothetical protein
VSSALELAEACLETKESWSPPVRGLFLPRARIRITRITVTVHSIRPEQGPGQLSDRGRDAHY